jgi:S-adenosylmethionine:tRNA ribosyltransferase-isomerase
LAIAKLRIVDALLTGAHEPDTSHHALLGAFLDETMLRQVHDELAANRYRTHEFGDPVLVERGVGSMVGRTEYTHRRIA